MQHDNLYNQVQQLKEFENTFSIQSVDYSPHITESWKPCLRNNDLVKVANDSVSGSNVPYSQEVGDTDNTLLLGPSLQNLNTLSWDSKIDDVATEFTLNSLQRRVLDITVCALAGKHQKGSQAFIYCGGEGGTGKTRVIAALVRLLEMANLRHIVSICNGVERDITTA